MKKSEKNCKRVIGKIIVAIYDALCFVCNQLYPNQTNSTNTNFSQNFPWPNWWKTKFLSKHRILCPLFINPQLLGFLYKPNWSKKKIKSLLLLARWNISHYSLFYSSQVKPAHVIVSRPAFYFYSQLKKSSVSVVT